VSKFLYFEIRQRWTESVMPICGSYFVLVPKLVYAQEIEFPQ